MNKQSPIDLADDVQTHGETWVDKFGRVRRPEQTFYDDDGTVTHGAQAIASANEWIDRTQVHRQPEGRGRAPREATNARRRGSRRGERATSSSSDDPGSEPPSEPPSLRRRICPGCGEEVGADRAIQAVHCTDKCGAAQRKRVERERKRNDPALEGLPDPGKYRVRPGESSRCRIF